MTNLPITGKFNVTATFGQSGKYWAKGHQGIDFTANNRTVYATCDGVVKRVDFDEGGWGRFVSVTAENGDTHIYCHLVIDSVRVKVGQRVSRTTVIGTMGSTGNSTGVHLHFQINRGGVAIDPTAWLMIPNKKGAYNSSDFEVGGDSMKFRDQDKIADWAKAAVDKVSDEGLMVGDKDGYFNPKGNLTREEAAVILARLLERE